MSLEDLYTLEIEGVVNTICDYTVENFIESYSNQLTQYRLSEDFEKIYVIVDRLISWYSRNIESIRISRFVVNKKEHEKSYQILIKMKYLLDEYKAD
mgnify:CR=1 FL=1